jgi:hypothetical protein
MPKMGRRVAGRAAMAATLKKERAKEHLKQMLEQTLKQPNDNVLQTLLKVRGKSALCGGTQAMARTPSRRISTGQRCIQTFAGSSSSTLLALPCWT